MGSEDSAVVELVARQSLPLVGDGPDGVGRIDVRGGGIPSEPADEGLPIGVGGGELPDVEARPHDRDVAGQDVVDEGPRQLFVVGRSDVCDSGVGSGQTGLVVGDGKRRDGPRVGREHRGAHGVHLAEVRVVARRVEQDESLRLPRRVAEGLGRAGQGGDGVGQVPSARLRRSDVFGGLAEVDLGFGVQFQRELPLLRRGRLGGILQLVVANQGIAARCRLVLLSGLTGGGRLIVAVAVPGGPDGPREGERARERESRRGNPRPPSGGTRRLRDFHW